jgi:hypothetical protein
MTRQQHGSIAMRTYLLHAHCWKPVYNLSPLIFVLIFERLIIQTFRIAGTLMTEYRTRPSLQKLDSQGATYCAIRIGQ